jgi:hypothetical protein
MNRSPLLGALTLASIGLAGCGDLPGDAGEDDVQTTSSALTYTQCKEKIGTLYNSNKALLGPRTTSYLESASGVHADYTNNATIYCKSANGLTHYVLGLIKGDFDYLGGVDYMGYPTTDEQDTYYADGRYNGFEKGMILWQAGADSANALRSPIYDTFVQIGFEWGTLGYPSNNQFTNASRIGNTFDNGWIFSKDGLTWPVLTQKRYGNPNATSATFTDQGWPVMKASIILRDDTGAGCLDISGSGFTPGGSVKITVNSPQKITYTKYLTASSTGTIGYAQSGSSCLAASQIIKLNYGVATVQATDQTTNLAATWGAVTAAGVDYTGPA